MIKRILILVTFGCISPFSYSLEQPQSNQTISQVTAAWAQTCTQNLTSTDLNLLANTLYLFHKLATVDATMRILADKATNNYVVVRTTLDGYEQNDNPDAQNELIHNFDHFIKNVVLLKELAIRRKPIFRAWQSCQNEVHQYSLDNPALDHAVDEFQEMCQAVIRQYLDDDQETINSLLRASETPLLSTISTLSTIVRTFQGLRSINHPSDEYQTSSVEKADVITRLADALENRGYQTLQTATTLSTQSADMQELTSSLLALLYTDLYEALSQEQRDELRVMFDERGMISSEERAFLLPLPEKLIGQ